MIEEKIRQAVEQAVAPLVSDMPSFTLEHPKEESHGDYAVNVAMQLASVLRRSPMQIAQEIADNLELPAGVSKLEVAAPGFINFWLDTSWLIENLQTIESAGTKYGSSDWGQGKTWLIEHTSPNPNKAMHLGHLRNNVTGMAIANIWEALGVTVIRDAIDNNRGIAIAKLMWGFLKFARKNENAPLEIAYWFDHQDEWHTPESLDTRPDRFMDRLYTLAADDCKNDAEVDALVRQMVVDWEAKDEKTWALWQHVLDYVYAGQNQTLQRLGNKWDKVWHEHEHYEKGKQYVEEGLAKGIFQKLDSGAILTDLESYNLPDTVVIKSDGTSLYITQDLALTDLKQKTFHPDKTFWVIGPEQSLAMKQVFAVSEQLGIGKVEDFTHIAYGYMSIKGQGKMSSRLGNVIYIDDLIDAAKEVVLAQMEARSFGSEEERQRVAEEIAVGSVKYSILKVGRLTDTAFDFATSLSVEGDAGPYLQYTYARSQSVLRKVETELTPVDSTIEMNEAEQAVLRWLYRYPEMVQEAGLQLSPNYLANYLYELSQRFNTFYNSNQILVEESEVKNFRLHLTKAVAQVLENGLQLLGIAAPERM